MTAGTIDKEAIHESFRLWQSDEQSLDVQLAESLAALEAFQSHLDQWQQELARERDELRLAKEEHEQAMATAKGEHAPNPSSAELDAANEDIAKLKEALQQMEQSRTQLAAELDQVRKDSSASHASGESGPASHAAPAPQPGCKNHARSASPVLGSIVEQFGKLRQQRALGRQSGKPPGRNKEQ